jgi:outer membrane protein OmpA-like peptidoglycan-associated protein
VSASATAGTYSFTVTASSNGYVTETFVVSFVIQTDPVVSYKTVKLSVYFNLRSSVLRTDQKSKLLSFIRQFAPKVIDGTVDGYIQWIGAVDKTFIPLSLARARVVAKFISDNGLKAPLVIRGMSVLNSSNAARVSMVELRCSV